MKCPTCGAEASHDGICEPCKDLSTERPRRTQLHSADDLTLLSWHEIRELLGREQAARVEYETTLTALGRIADSAADAQFCRVGLANGRKLLEGVG